MSSTALTQRLTLIARGPAPWGSRQLESLGARSIAAVLLEAASIMVATGLVRDRRNESAQELGGLLRDSDFRIRAAALVAP